IDPRGTSALYVVFYAPIGRNIHSAYSQGKAISRPQFKPLKPDANHRIGPTDCASRPASRSCYVVDMCGRARLSSDVSEIKLVFSIPPERPTPNFPPSWNLAPSDTLPVVRYDAKAEQRSLDMLRWGLIPYWAKDIKVGFANINAKAEGIETRPAFRDAFQRRRCLVPADNFYEWKKTATGKLPMRWHSPIAASWRLRACGRTGMRPAASGYAASRSSPPRPTVGFKRYTPVSARRHTGRRLLGTRNGLVPRLSLMRLLRSA
ncbi:MAG: SOS response-associated peptidase, partial [Xanthobacteraceae bacterium]